jgi:hypothetical protein
MSPRAITALEGSLDDARARWARETRAAIAFEEDPHKAALDDDPELVYIGPRTWAAIFVSALYLSFPPLI